MADIFLSYARADQPRIEKLAEALEAAGHTLWWDRNIDGGQHFAQDIERELEAAKVVIVAWSANSVKSHWVLDEASFARDANKLVPISLDGTPPPIGYRQIQSIDFGDWPRKEGPMALLDRAVTRHLGDTADTPAAPAPDTKTSGRRPFMLAIAAVAALAIAISAWFVWDAGDSAAEKRNYTIAVLPFTNSAGDQFDVQREAYPAAIIDGLSHIPDVDILSARTSFARASEGLSSVELAEALNADYLIEGVLQDDGESLRASVRLVDGKTGRPVWNDSRHNSQLSMTELHRQSVRYVAAALQGYLGIGLGYLPADSSLSGEALDQYRRGMTLLLTRANAEESSDSYTAFKRATELAPNSADAHAALAYALTDIGPFTLAMDHADFRAENTAAYERALELDPDSMFGLIAKAETIHKEDGDIAQALELFERVMAQDPDFGPAHEHLAGVYASAGDHRAALEAASRALTLAPFDDQLVEQRFEAMTALKRYANVRNETLSCNVNCGPAGLGWLLSMAALVEEDELDAELSRFRRFATAGQVPQSAIENMEAYIRAVVEQRPAPAAGEAFNAFFDTMYHLRVSDDDTKLLWLERFFETQHAGTIHYLFNDDRFTPPPHIRAHPRYHGIFEDTRFGAVADYRREKGLLAGLPIAPEDVPAEEARLREKGVL